VLGEVLPPGLVNVFVVSVVVLLINPLRDPGIDKLKVKDILVRDASNTVALEMIERVGTVVEVLNR
jgi:hypothetical protein